MKKLIVALGSDIIMDDALSINIAKDIIQSLPDFELQILPFAGIELIEIISGFSLVVIIDTIISPDGKPGEIVLFNDFQSARTLNLVNPHDVDFHTSIKLAEELGYRLPDRIVVLGIQITQHLTASQVLSPAMLEKYDKLVNQVKKIITQLNT